MTPEESNKKIEETIKTMTTLMKGLGIVMMAFGSFCLLTVEFVQDFTGYSAVTITIISCTLLATGLGIIAVPFIEKMKMRKLR